MAILINPGDDVQAFINANPPGTHYIFVTGVHRGVSFTPQSGDLYTGQHGAVLNGAKVLAGWQQDALNGDHWYVGGQTQTIARSTGAVCEVGYPRCDWNVDLYADDAPLKHVGSLNDLIAGTFYFDETNDRVYIGDDPAQYSLIELSDVAYALDGETTSNVTLRNLTIEKYATPAQQGAIRGNTTTDWLLEGVTSRLNHGGGIRPHDGWVIRNCRFMDNGQIGLASNGGDDVLIENCEFARNNYAGFSVTWEAGASKFVRMNRLTVRSCYVHDNNGKGLWADIDNLDLIYEYNICVNNRNAGIHHEISFDAIIRHNWCGYNATVDYGGGLVGSQITVQNSKNVELHDNTVIVAATGGNGIGIRQTDRGFSPIYPTEEWLCQNNHAHHNTLVYLGNNNARSGGRAFHQQADFLTPGNNHYDHNTYYVQSLGEYNWTWDAADRQFSDWQTTYNQDANGTESTSIPTGIEVIPSWVMPPLPSSNQIPQIALLQRTRRRAR